MTQLRPPRSKVIAFLITVGCVLLAATGLAVSEPDDDFEVVHGVRGKPVAINHGDVIVTEVRTGSALAENGVVKYRTAGLFVVVSLTATAPGSKPVSLSDSRLLSGDRVYLPYSTFAAVNAKPGFRSSVDFAYEVDPAMMNQLTIELWRREVLVGYHQRVRLPLGIRVEDTQRWRHAARALVLEPRTNAVSEVIP